MPSYSPTRRHFLVGLGCVAALPTFAEEAALLVDDLSTPGTTQLGTPWRSFTDQVMGGRSTMQAQVLERAGRPALQFSADVTTANNGGFAQIAADLSQDGAGVDLSAFTTLELDVYGNGEAYDVHLRTAACRRPWQYYTQRFIAPPEWTRVRLPLSAFEPKSLDRVFEPENVLRIGLVAYGRDFRADLAVSRIAFVS